MVGLVTDEAAGVTTASLSSPFHGFQFEGWNDTWGVWLAAEAFANLRVTSHHNCVIPDVIWDPYSLRWSSPLYGFQLGGWNDTWGVAVPAEVFVNLRVTSHHNCVIPDVIWDPYSLRWSSPLYGFQLGGLE